MAEKKPGEELVYEISPLDTDIPSEWNTAGIYTLETPARCPYCRAPIRTLKAIRLTRTQVAFTSTLPRSGRAIVCPECDRIISAELGGII